MNNYIMANDYGTKFYYANNVLHREDGPAIECSYGYKQWYKDGKLHKEEGPAIEWSNGSKKAFENTWLLSMLIGNKS